MIKSRRQARLTNKTRLAVHRGDLEGAEPVLLDDESGSGKSNLNSDGVEKGEDQEHHLQAAISAAAIRAAASSRPSASSPNARSSTSSAKPPPPISETLYHIPTPDATGIVSNYTDLYIPGRWHDPNSYVSFSDTVEETSAGPAGLGFVYTLDERDDEWLKNSNRIARGESTNGSASDAGRTSRKGKGRESEEIVPVISEDEFELVMALMEKWTDERFPTLHTDVARLPAFSDMEALFSHNIPPNFFPTYTCPTGVPAPGVLSRMAKAIYPHWKDRRVFSEGKSIIPQLNYDESNDGDPYVCFRRREAKPVRKTRRTDSQSVDRLVLLQAELMKAQQLAVDTLARERRKAELVQAEREAWEGKLRLIEVKRKFPAMGIKPDEEDLLFRTGIGSSKKQKLDPVLDPAAKAAKGARKGRDSAAGSPAPGQDGKDRGGDAERHMPVEALRERTAAIAMQIEREVARKREGDYQWEDYTDLAYQPLITPAPLRLFRPLVPELTPIPQPTTTTTPTTTTSPTSSTSSILSPEPLRSSSFRLRRGRGGIIRLDRRVDTRSSAGSKPRGIPAPSWRDERKREKGEPLLDCLFPDEWSSLPTGPKRDRVEDEEAVSTSMEGVLESNPVEEKSTENDEYGRRVSERWRYDSEAGVVGVGMGMHGLEDEERVIVDDFEERHLRVRLTLFEDGDLATLSTDASHLHASELAAEQPPERPPTVILVRHQPPPQPQAPPMRRIDSGGPGMALQQQQQQQQQQKPMNGQHPHGPPSNGPQSHLPPNKKPPHPPPQLQRRPTLPLNGARPPTSSPHLQGSPPLHPNAAPRPNGYPTQMNVDSIPSGQQPPFLNSGFPSDPYGGQQRMQNGARASNHTPAQLDMIKSQLIAQQRQTAAAGGGVNGSAPKPNPQAFQLQQAPINLKLPPARNGMSGGGVGGAGGAQAQQQAAWRAQQQQAGGNGGLRAPGQNGGMGGSPLPSHASPAPSPHQQVQHVGGSS